MIINKEYKIEADELNVTLLKRYMGKPKDGKPSVEKFKVIGYYSSIPSALEALVDLKVSETGLKDLRVVTAKLDEIYKQIEKAFREGKW